MAEPTRIEEVPVFINCRDRVTDLRILVDWLLQAHMQSITLLDNASTYPELLAYYHLVDRSRYFPGVRVHPLSANIGHLALFLAGLAPDGPFILTDPDLVPLGPTSGLQHLWDLAHRYQHARKVGFGLELEGATMPAPVRQHEQSFWATELEVEPGVFFAPIDTTFALWMPRKSFECIRTGRPHVMRHTSYFTDYTKPELLSEEERYYLAHANSSSGWKGDIQRYG